MRVCLSVTFLIINQWQSCVCFIRSGVTRCTLLMVLYLDRICQRELHAVLWSQIGTLMVLFPSRCPSGTIMLTQYSMVWDWRVSRAGPMLLYWPKMLYPYYSLLLFFPFSSFCIEVGIVGLGSSDWVIGCIPLSLSLALPTFFNNNNNNKPCKPVAFYPWIVAWTLLIKRTHCRFHGCLYIKQAEWASTLTWLTRKWAVQSFVFHHS